MKRTLLVITSLASALLSWADDSGKCGNDLTWTYVEETKTLTISGSGAMPNNKNALMEEYPWFYTVYDKTEKVVIEDGVTSIGDGAFYLFSKLTSIEIPNSVKRIGYGAFGSCTSLTSFVLPPSVETLDNEVFYDCRNLTSLIVDEANPVFDSRGGCNAIIKTATNELIQGCATTVIPDDVTRIGNYAFCGCYGLRSITIPQSVSTIGSHAFAGCIQLTSIEIPSSMNGIGEGVFTSCSSMVSVTLPNTITSIGAYAFMECSSLASIEIPSSVTFINIYAFAHCSGLTSVEIPGNVKELAQGAFQQCKGLQTVKIADGVTTIKYNVFKDCDNLMSVEISGSVKEIGQGAFQNCKSLTSVKIADGTTTLYNSVFKDCVNLASIEIPTSVTSVGMGVFDNTAWLANHPDGVVYAGSVAYQYKGTMPNNTDIELREGTTGITERVFQNCKGMRSIIIPNSVTTIGNYAFFNCTGLKSIEIPNSVTTIGNGAFDSCEGLKTVRIERHIQQIGANAFAGLYNLTDFYCLAEQIPTTGSWAFDETSDHVTLHVPASALEAYKSTDPWSEFKNIVAITIEDEQDDYLPFVELGKQWYVVSKNENPNYVSRWERYWMFEKVERGGKTYVHVYLNNDILCTSKEEGLFREEGRMVYKYDETTGRDVMLYDFSLKEGDTFTYEYGFDHPVNCKVLKQGWLKDGPQIVSSITRVSADSLDVKYRRLRTWTIGREGTDGQYQEVTTWVEGIGAFENMFSPLNMNKEGKSCLAYVKRDESISDYSKNAYLPFSFSNISDVFGQIHGCNLPTGAEDNWESDGRHQLTYELEGNRLHVYGKVFTQCGPNNYAFFYEKPTDDPLVHKIEFIIQEVEPTMDCMALHQTDFYVPGFDPNMNYIVIDNNGEEHPVINENPQMAYRPFIEEDKVWKVGKVFGWESGAQFINYLYFDGDTIINGQKAKRMLRDQVAAKEWESQNVQGEYVGAWYEKDKKVYCMNNFNNDFKLVYDFSLNVNDTINLYDYMVYGDNGITGIVTQRASGGIPGFKGMYLVIQTLWRLEDGTGTLVYDVKWMEGIGSDFPPLFPPFDTFQDPQMTGSIGYVLMSCAAGDEVIYYNSKIDDPYGMGTKKRRFDFNHTIKTQPKAPRRSEGLEGLYGEYNDQLLDVKLNPLDEAYLVHITDKAGQAVYEKTINAGNIVALNIDISAYPEGQYTVTIENSKEAFTGVFEINTTEIEQPISPLPRGGELYNLQGQRISVLQKGINIINGKKVWVK